MVYKLKFGNIVSKKSLKRRYFPIRINFGCLDINFNIPLHGNRSERRKIKLKASLSLKTFLILSILSASLTVAIPAKQGLSSNSSQSFTQLKQTESFAIASEDPVRVAIECANGSASRDTVGNDPVYSMQNLFESRGFITTIVNGSSIDTVEELENYDVVVIGDSGWGDNDFSVFQSALKQWVQNGGGVVATGWTIDGMFGTGMTGQELDQILPVSPPYDFENSGNVTMIYGKDSSITQGVDRFPIYNYVEFPRSHEADPGSTVSGFTISTGTTNVTSPATAKPVVASWSYELGRAVYLGPIYFADFQSYTNEGLYTDVDAVRLLLNSVEWAASFTPKPIVAECLILSNDWADTCALDFTLKIAEVDFAWMDVSVNTPSISNVSAYDVVLLFEEGIFANAPNVGSTVYEYVMAGGNLVIGTFYEQDRSDINSTITFWTPYGWGPLETIDPFTSDTKGCEYSYDELNVSSLVPHPITFGVQSLWSNNYNGGVHAKPSTVVVANWTGPNYVGEDCPLAGYRIQENGQRVVQISVYPATASLGNETGGDFYTLWANSLIWAATKADTVLSATLNATPIALGSSVTISGNLNASYGIGLEGKEVIIQYSTDNENWNTATTTTTSLDGSYSSSWAPPSTGNFYIRATWLGDEIYNEATSASLMLSVKELSTISCQFSSTSIAVGSSVTISGGITPTRAGTLVTIYYRLSGAAMWDILTSAITNSTSTYATTISTWNPPAIGTYEVKASWLGDSTTFSNESSVQTIAVEKASSTISCVLSASRITEDSNVTVYGAISPSRSSVAVTIQYRTEGTTTWNTLATANTDTSGGYSFMWTSLTSGTYEVKAAWEGDVKTLADESTVQTVTVEAPTMDYMPYAIGAIIGLIIGALAVAAIFIVGKKKPPI